jgi:DTW domain-containing protein YfiP
LTGPASTTEPCERCGKQPALCVCDRVVVHDDVTTRVLVLQHPQEPDAALGTVPLLLASLPTRVVVRVGLSWPSLAAALGEPAEAARWGVLYPMSLQKPLTPEHASRPFLTLDRHGNPRAAGAPALAGLIVLDGTWSQGKTLWWRNAWLLKLPRVVLRPSEPGIYGKLRQEPRREHVSTLEAVADALVGNGEPVAIRDDLRRAMRTMVQRARDARTKRAQRRRMNDE